jgi:putative ABC transport system permease protein
MTVLFRIAVRSVRKNWRHSLGSLLAIAVGFAALALFGGYLADFEGLVSGLMAERYMMGTLMVEGRGYSAALAAASAKPPRLGAREQALVDGFLRDHAGEVVVSVRSHFVSGLASNGRASTPFVGWGYDPAEAAVLRRRFAWDAWYGRPLHEAGPSSVQLARGLAGLLECEPATKESPFRPDGTIVPKARPFACRRPRVQLMGNTASGQVNAVEPEVVGVIDGGRNELDAQLAMMPLALAQRLADTREISQYNVLLRDPSRAAAFGRELTAAAAASGLAVDAMPWQESYHGALYRQGMGILGTFRGLMGLVIVGIAGMAIFMTMVRAVDERTREIGTLRSLGFVRGQIVRLFALEAALLAGGACGAGALLALAISAAVNAAKVTYRAGIMANPIPLGVATDPASYLRIAAFLVAIAVFAAWLPARRAARRRIPDALAYA